MLLEKRADIICLAVAWPEMIDTHVQNKSAMTPGDPVDEI